MARWDRDREGLHRRRSSIVEECARTGARDGKIPGQDLAKEMGAVLETLQEESPCELSGGLGVRVLPGEGKEQV